jgi:hypothetical protein
MVKPDLIDRYVRPFYLDLMGCNAVRHVDKHVASLRALGPTLDASDVAELLGSLWRPRVMGAWFSLFRPPTEVRSELLRSLETSLGGLTAPPLATVAVYLLGDMAAPSLKIYGSTEAANRDSSWRFTAAALEHLGVDSGGRVIEDEDRASFASMLSVAQRLAP